MQYIDVRYLKHVCKQALAPPRGSIQQPGHDCRRLFLTVWILFSWAHGPSAKECKGMVARPSVLTDQSFISLSPCSRRHTASRTGRQADRQPLEHWNPSPRKGCGPAARPTRPAAWFHRPSLTLRHGLLVGSKALLMCAGESTCQQGSRQGPMHALAGAQMPSSCSVRLGRRGAKGGDTDRARFIHLVRVPLRLLRVLVRRLVPAHAACLLLGG